MIIDKFNREHNYLRIAITDNCNFRCTYCMPSGEMSFLPSGHLMTADEIYSIAESFVKLGVEKIRLTGGEPLVRKDAKTIIQKLSSLPVELTLTTNAVLAGDYIDTFKQAGIRSVNVSLDSLQPDKFFKITRRDAYHRVWLNILKLLMAGINVKLNVVAMKGVNDDEILDFIKLTKSHPLHVRFIEFMPFTGNKWDKQKVVTTEEILSIIESEYSFIKMKDEKNATAKKYKPLNHKGTFAIITTMSNPFCSNCNRMRLTADGKMKNCLFSADEVDLLTAYRNGENISPIIHSCILNKKEERGGQFKIPYQEMDVDKIINRSMVNIGG